MPTEPTSWQRPASAPLAISLMRQMSWNCHLSFLLLPQSSKLTKNNILSTDNWLNQLEKDHMKQKLDEDHMKETVMNSLQTSELNHPRADLMQFYIKLIAKLNSHHRKPGVIRCVRKG